MASPIIDAMSYRPKNPLQALSPKAVGILAAVVTVVIWTSFIVIARASADPARGGVLNPFDIVYARLWGAGLILLPWGWWLVRRDRRTQPQAGSLFGLSPLPLRQTLITGVLGGLLYLSLRLGGNESILSHPLLALMVLLFFGGIFGLLFGGLLSLRPDHYRVMAAVRKAIKRGRWAVISHPVNHDQTREVINELHRHRVNVVRSL